MKFNVVALAFARFAKAGSAVALLGLVDWGDTVLLDKATEL